MSTLVVVKKNGYATIACDSLSTDGTITIPTDNKVNNHKFFKVNDSFVGFVGWSNINNIFEDIIDNNSEHMEFTTQKAIFSSLNQLHPILKDEYFINTQEEDDQPVESSQISGLMVTPEGIFEFCSSRSVDEYSKYWALGSGRRYALGSMFNSYNQDKTSEEIAIAAVEASCCFDDGSGLPVLFQTIKLKNV